ncbi:MAG: metal-dependent transcriptional regulator [Clostridia bacterium]|nr:metal-dependent transcriptional regulator [Clostridia bacterium]MDD4145664.1 metal-dependent transcriptional regulator [Clostridia bacterium]MDD4665150.1 metal-dependent transcriptional regulator [Clostridia bacterium]
MVTTLTPSTQDYLEVILQLSNGDRAVRITDIAKSLNITKASATQAIDILIDEGLVLKEKYGPVTFTGKGELEATKVKKTHKIIREFLTKVLQVDLEIADKDACLIEHVISPQSIAGMVAFLEKGNYEISDDLNLQKALVLLYSDQEDKQ